MYKQKHFQQEHYEINITNIDCELTDPNKKCKY